MMLQRKKIDRLGARIRTAALSMLVTCSTVYAADDTGNLKRYLRQDSPLTQIEVALGINHAESRQLSRLTSVPQSNPITAQGHRGAFSMGRLFQGWRGFGNGDRTYGVRGAGAWQRLSGVSNRIQTRHLYGVSPRSGGRSDFGTLFYRWGNDQNLLFRNQPRPRRNEIYGPRWRNSNRILERTPWRTQNIYGAGLSNTAGRLLGLRRSAITSRSMSGVNVSGPSAILDRSGLGRRSGLSGKRLIGF